MDGAAVIANCENWKRMAGNWEQDMNTLLGLLNSHQPLGREQVLYVFVSMKVPQIETVV